MRRLLLLALALPVAALAAGPNVLNDSAHVATVIAPAINAALGSGHVDVVGGIYVDESSTAGNTMSIGMSGYITAPTDATRVYYSAATSGALSAGAHTPYGVITHSYSGADGFISDANNYVYLSTNGIVDNWAYVPGSSAPAGTQPAAASTTIALAAYTGWGVEFGMSAGYTVGGIALDTSSPSSTGASFAGLLAALKYTNSGLNWFDIRGALRQTAANWPTYNYAAQGYGWINYAAAAALSSSASIYLQPPVLAVASHGSWAGITVYPFSTTRRNHDSVYVVNSAYSWPAPANGYEYTSSEWTTTIAAASGTLLGTNTTTAPGTLGYYPSANGTTTFIAVTVDASGNVSRIQPYQTTGTLRQATLTVSNSCLRQ